MKKNRAISIMFVIAALYDGLLGCCFLLAGRKVFDWFSVTPPNHPGYVQFPAALLLVFTIMFISIAMNPVKNRGLILYCILLKVSYCGVVGFHWVTKGIPGMWKPFCLLDLVFMVLFVVVWIKLNREAVTEKAV